MNTNHFFLLRGCICCFFLFFIPPPPLKTLHSQAWVPKEIPSHRNQIWFQHSNIQTLFLHALCRERCALWCLSPCPRLYFALSGACRVQQNLFQDPYYSVCKCNGCIIFNTQNLIFTAAMKWVMMKRETPNYLDLDLFVIIGCNMAISESDHKFKGTGFKFCTV